MLTGILSASQTVNLVFEADTIGRKAVTTRVAKAWRGAMSIYIVGTIIAGLTKQVIIGVFAARIAALPRFLYAVATKSLTIGDT